MKIKKTDFKNTNGTSWHGDTIYTSVFLLTKLFGKPDSYGDVDDKSQYDWSLELEDGTPFTIYDWKEYRKFDRDEHIEFHIGGHRSLDTIKVRKEIEKLLN